MTSHSVTKRSEKNNFLVDSIFPFTDNFHRAETDADVTCMCFVIVMMKWIFIPYCSCFYGSLGTTVNAFCQDLENTVCM